jgi:hypothetical protein
MKKEIKMRINDIEDCSNNEKLVLGFLFGEGENSSRRIVGTH